MNRFPGFKGWLFARAGGIGLGFYSFLGCGVAGAVVGLASLTLNQPMLVPSIGPTLLLFFESALQPAACPRNTLIGHGVGIAAGWISLVAFGLPASPSVLTAGFSGARVGAAAMSLALTALVKHVFDAPHPPAGATTLIVSLGLLTSAGQLASIAAGVVLATAAAWCTSRLLGVPMPLWGPRRR